MKNSRRILSLVIAGYTIILMLVLIMGPMIIHTFIKLQSFTSEIYYHPFKVSNAALMTKNLMHGIRDDMLEAGMTTDVARLKALKNHVEESDQKMRQVFKPVAESFLGDKKRINETLVLFDTWKKTRDIIFHYALAGNHQMAKQLILTEGSSVFSGIENALDAIIVFAQEKAAQFVANSTEESLTKVNTLWFLIAGIVISSGLIAFFIVRSISNDLKNGKEAIARLEDSELRFHTMFDSANDGLFVMDNRGVILDVSRVGYERLGYTKEEMVGRKIAEFDAPEFISRVPERIETLMRFGQARFESCHLHRNGTRVEVEISARTITIKGVIQIFSVIRDITDRKILEQKLKESESRFHTLFEISSDFKVILSLQGEVMDVNASYLKAMGYDKKELVGKKIFEFVSDKYSNEIPGRMKTIASDGSAIFESEHVRKDGSLMPVEVSTKLVELSGEMYHYSIIRDITERKEIDSLKRKNQEKYQAVIDTLADGFWIVDLQGKFLEVNDVYLKLSGYSREEILLMRVPDVEARETPEDTREHIEKILVDGHDRFETIHRRKNGEIWPVEIVTNYWPINEGLLFVFVIDISERKKIENELILMASVFQNSGEAMLISDSRNRIQKVNPAFVELTGYSPEDVIGADPKIVSAGKQSKEFYREMWGKILQEGKWQGEIWDRRKDGREYPKWLTISAVENKKGRVENYIGIFSDITERKKAEAEIMELAFHDTLTGLHNRHSLISHLDQELIEAKRNGRKLAIMFIDLDRFKAINDTLGHHIGDHLLIEIASRMRASVRESDLIARLGGDEFVIVLLDINSQDDAMNIARKIVSEVSRIVEVENQKIYTSPSIGISLYPDHGTNTSDLMQKADMAMYFSKTGGGSMFHLFENHMRKITTERMSIENSLRSAIEEDQLCLYYQPIMNREGRISGMEALVRWNHPELGLLTPESFIPIAEESNLIIALGQWVFHKACETLKKWNDAGFMDIFMAVNISAHEFTKENFDKEIHDKITEFGILPSQIELEITESTAMKNPEKILKIMRNLKSRDVRISIDDFGTGYSSLGYLARFPIDQLKIDHSFIRDIEKDSTMLAVTLATISLAKQLGKQVVVEGVENEKQKEILFEKGSDLQQGYLYSRPIPEKDFLILLENQRKNSLV